VSGSQRGAGPVGGSGRYRAVVASLRYKPGWTFKVAGPDGRLLCVYATTPDSSHPQRLRTTQHQFELPPDGLTDREFVRWVFDQLLLCEFHEAAEFYTVDGFAPFYPNHQDEGSPYDLVERWEA
jgi:hypothetical protein